MGSVTGTSTNGAWVRSRGRVEEAPANGRLTRLLGEARWIVGALLGLALFAMLVTYSKADPSFTHAVSGTNVSNLGGRVGAWVADIALLAFRALGLRAGVRARGVGRARLPCAAP